MEDILLLFLVCFMVWSSAPALILHEVGHIIVRRLWLRWPTTVRWPRRARTYCVFNVLGVSWHIGHRGSQLHLGGAITEPWPVPNEWEMQASPLALLFLPLAGPLTSLAFALTVWSLAQRQGLLSVVLTACACSSLLDVAVNLIPLGTQNLPSDALYFICRLSASRQTQKLLQVVFTTASCLVFLLLATWLYRMIRY